jgi:hypothetical protein
MKLDTRGKKLAAIAFSVITISVAAFLIYRYEHRPPEAQLQHHHALGRVLAKEVVRLLEGRDKKRLLVITAESPDPILSAQMATFSEEMKKHSDIEIKETEKLEQEGNRRVGAGQGLSARKFVRILENNRKADAIVSLVGLPDPDEPEMKSLTSRVPRFVAETVHPDRAEKMFEQKTLRAAVAPRFQFPSPVKDPKTEKDWFDKYFQMLKPAKTTNAVATPTNSTPAVDRKKPPTE